ncbi:MAG TPA: type II toxin-antitoxin system VapC family toxin [Gemmatimonadales bacterium]|nr:type II toxin-antitoxin system VapC family toxin [Gemmatimonadales bacterium]
MTKFVLDTNIFIHADRDPAWAEQLVAFYATFLPVTFLHAIVVQELLLGAVDPRRGRDLYAAYVAPFEARQRIVTPSYTSWRRSGQVVAALVQRRRVSPGGFSRSFLNDVLLAASCREAGLVLITTDTADFSRIRIVEAVQFTQPWPRP